MEIPILDLKPQYFSIKSEIEEAIARVIESGSFILGADVELFEQEVAAYLGVKYAIGVNSGTDALVIGLRALGICEGDEVITTPFSFFATAESINNVGAIPIFVDIDPLTYNINPQSIESKITKKTKAIMPVHLYGQPAEMSIILEIANRHKLKIIEDCAQSFGARFITNSVVKHQPVEKVSDLVNISGKHVGGIGDVGAFSFYPSKNLGAYGDGGMITTNNELVAKIARMLRVHGGKEMYKHEMFGYNSRLDSIQAAILRVKLKYIEKWNFERRKVAQRYNDLLEKIEGIKIPYISEGHVFHQYTIRVLNEKRDYIKKILSENNIKTMIYYRTPQDLLPVFKQKFSDCIISEQSSREVLSLPIWPELEFNKQKKVADIIRESLMQ